MHCKIDTEKCVRNWRGFFEYKTQRPLLISMSDPKSSFVCLIIDYYNKIAATVFLHRILKREQIEGVRFAGGVRILFCNLLRMLITDYYH